MKKAESEIEDFQTLKQRKLNELDVIVPLRLSQIQHPILDGPVDLTTHLVFYNEGLAQLKRRIKELHQEKNDIKKQHKELRKQHVSFSKSKKEKEERVAELSEKANDVQMLKFGQIVDLEKLEKLGVNKAADELKEKLSRDDRQRLREVADMDVSFESNSDQNKRRERKVHDHREAQYRASRADSRTAASKTEPREDARFLTVGISKDGIIRSEQERGSRETGPSYSSPDPISTHRGDKSRDRKPDP